MTTIDTTQGRLEGREQSGTHRFLGIPYAAPPVPPHRFRAPRPATPWAGVRQAASYGPQAMQPLFPFQDPALANDPFHQPNRDFHAGIDLDPIPYAEDCLYLNVWTSGIAGRRPVMVWLHGGGFSAGAGSWGWFDGADLARDGDVVVVTVNHRLNVFGFLALDALGGRAAGYTPNAGMLDLVAALEWVRDNIAAFGGDPGRVTIFGQSGGGMKVTSLMAMPAARGLFHRAIVQSGPFLRAVPNDRAEAAARGVLAHVGATTIDALQHVPAGALADAFVAAREGAPGVPRQFAPTLADNLPADPFDPMPTPLAAGVPMLIGATTEEVTSLQGFADPSIFSLAEADIAPKLAAATGASLDAAQKAVATYRAARPNASPSRLYAAAASDWRFGHPSIVQAERHSAQAPTFAYLLSWQSPVQGGRMGAPHNLCLPLVFGRDCAPGVTGAGTAHHALAAAMRAAWTRFAHDGAPGWPRFDPATRATMRFDDPCRLEHDPNPEARAAMALLPLRV